MPEYMAPGVYTEEPGRPTAVIRPLGMDVALFVGPTRRAPAGIPHGAVLLEGMAAFERFFGRDADLSYSSGPANNDMAHSVRAFFAEGGRQLYVRRVMGPGAAGAAAVLASPGDGSALLTVFAQGTGEAGNGELQLREVHVPADRRVLGQAPPGSLAVIPGSGALFTRQGNDWLVAGEGGGRIGAERLEAEGGVLLSLDLSFTNQDGEHFDYPGLAFDPADGRWLGAALAPAPAGLQRGQGSPYAVKLSTGVDGPMLYRALFGGVRPDRAGLHSRRLTLTGGADGLPPGQGEYAQALRDLPQEPRVALLAAPGSSALPAAGPIADQLLHAAEAPGAACMAVLDLPRGLTSAQALAASRRWNSDRAVVYYPWVAVAVPPSAGTGGVVQLPPSGFLCGLYARSDRERGVWKAPANLALRSAVGLERALSNADQELLNPAGVNCLRDFRSRGFLVWGARTLSSDPEWKYIVARRYLDFLQVSIEAASQWVVFEPNAEPLWRALRTSIENFLMGQWREGALQGAKPEQAFFVRCGHDTMTEADIQSGQLVCLFGVAQLRPAEFAVSRLRFRLGTT